MVIGGQRLHDRLSSLVVVPDPRGQREDALCDADGDTLEGPPAVRESRGFATMGELARAMILQALASPLPIAWVTGDCAYGQEWRMRRTLEEADVGYVLAVPKSQQLHAPFGRIDHTIAQAPEEAWERLS
jgi:SRSO17 transposase